MVSFTPRPLYPGGNRPWYLLDRRLGGPQSRSRPCGEEKNLALPGIEPGSSIPQPVAVPTEGWKVLWEKAEKVNGAKAYITNDETTHLFLNGCLVVFFSFSGWGETESTWYVGHCWPVVPAPDDR
jgi:hypothetical protein